MRKQAGFMQVYLIIGVVMAAMCGGFYLYYQDSQATIMAQSQTIAAQQVDIETNKKIIAQKEADIRLQSEIANRVSELFVVTRSEAEELREKFDKVNEATQKKRDIGQLAYKKSARIQKIINNATKNVFRCYEITAGAPLTAEEIAATKKSEANNECPSIANPNYTLK